MWNVEYVTPTPWPGICYVCLPLDKILASCNTQKCLKVGLKSLLTLGKHVINRTVVTFFPIFYCNEIIWECSLCTFENLFPCNNNLLGGKIRRIYKFNSPSRLSNPLDVGVRDIHMFASRNICVCVSVCVPPLTKLKTIETWNLALPLTHSPRP